MSTENFTLSLGYIITIGISSGLFAGLVSTIGNIFIAYYNKKSEKNVENMKHQNSINDYRYKELHEYLKNVCDIQNKEYLINSKEGMLALIENSNNEDEKVMSIYRKAFPLLNKALQEELITARKEVDTISRNLVEKIYAEKDSEYGIKDLIKSRDDFKNKLIDVLQKQLINFF